MMLLTLLKPHMLYSVLSDQRRWQRVLQQVAKSR